MGLDPSLPPIYQNGKVVPGKTIYQNGQVVTPMTGAAAPPTDTNQTARVASNKAVAATAAKPNQWGQTPAQVKAMQQFLAGRGFYKGPIDGIRGNGTNAAIMAFHNRNSKAPAGGNNHPPQSTPPAGNTPPAGGGVPPTAATPATPTIPLIDPNAYATATANAQYDPQIAALASQIGQGKAQGTQDQKDLQNWYNQLQALATSTGKDTVSADNAAQQGYDAAGNTALSQLFGGGTAPNSSTAEAQTFHDINAGQLAANNTSDQNFNQRMKDILSAAGGESSQHQMTLDNNNVQNLLAQQVALKGAKGQAYTSAYQTGLGNEQQQSAAQQAAQLAAALAPSQVATAQANATAAGANATTAQVNATTAPKIAQANLAAANAKLAAAKQAAAGGAGWNLNVPAQKGALSAALKGAISGPNGGLAVDPQTAWANIQNALTTAGLGSNATAKQIAQAVYTTALHTSHSQGRYGGYAWTGKRIANTGNRYTVKNGKTVLVNAQGKVIPNYIPKN